MNYSQNASVLFIYASYSILCSALIFSDFTMSKQSSSHNNQPAERTPDSFFAIVQIAPVPVDVKLSKVLFDVSPHVRDVIGIMRVADYKAKRQGETVFVYCMNHSNAQILESIKLEYNNQPVTPLTVSMKVGRATFIDKNFATSFDGVPISIILKGLERQREMTIYYIMELARQFEKKGVITGVRLGFNEKRNWSTSQGYITFLRQADARACSGEGGFVEHTIHDRKVRASLSENIPMLVAHEDLNRFPNGIINWGEEAESINQLVMTFQWPMHLAERQVVNNKELLKKLHKKYENVEFDKYSSEYTKKNIYVPFENPAKRAKLAENDPSKEPVASHSKDIPAKSHPPKIEIPKVTSIPEVRDSPESPFEDIMSDSDEEVLRIDLEADTVVE